MKKLSLLLVCLAFAGTMWSCGGNEDAEKFCSCFEKFEAGEEDACEEEMEALEEKLKADEARYEAFREAAMKKCPDAERFINRMN